MTPLMDKLLLFGGGGFVGGNIARLALARGWQVSIADSARRPGISGADWIVTDIVAEDGVAAAFEAVRPDAVVNAAAVADIDRAERERELAWNVNVVGARRKAVPGVLLGMSTFRATPCLMERTVPTRRRTSLLPSIIMAAPRLKQRGWLWRRTPGPSWFESPSSWVSRWQWGTRSSQETGAEDGV